MAILLVPAFNLLRPTVVTSVTKNFRVTDLREGRSASSNSLEQTKRFLSHPFIQNSLEVKIDELLLNRNLLLPLEFLFAFAVRLFVNCCMKTARCKRTTRTHRTPSGSKPSRVNS